MWLKNLRPTYVHFIGNKTKGRVSRRMFQENKARQIFRKTNISFPLIRTGAIIVRFSENQTCFVFLKRPFVLLWRLKTTLLRLCCFLEWQINITVNDINELDEVPLFVDCPMLIQMNLWYILDISNGFWLCLGNIFSIGTERFFILNLSHVIKKKLVRNKFKFRSLITGFKYSPWRK